MQEIAQKIGNVENDAEEHKSVLYSNAYRFQCVNVVRRLVLETLQPLTPDRKCFQMIHGVLAEKRVGDVIPSLRTNSEGLRKVLEDLVKSYDTARKELELWKKKNNVQIVQQ